MKKITLIFVALVSVLVLSTPAFSQSIKVKIHGEPGLDPCGGGTVGGLKKSGDGFLAVRSGPSTKYKMKDKLYNGKRILLCDQRGDWFGVIYTKKNTDCFEGVNENITSTYKGRCWSGWVHKNWIKNIAG